MASFFFTLVILFYVISSVDANGITVDIIHRDSPLSPFSNPNATRFERLQNLFDRSVAHKASPSTSVPLEGNLDQGEYLMKISIGTPPVEVTHIIVDTGSDLLWTSCHPCKGCGVKNFDPNKSTSYRNISCKSNQLCQSLDNSKFCDEKKMFCKYHTAYRDESFSSGDLAQDIITLPSSSGESMSSRVVFGCGREISGTSGTGGIMGLGPGDLSIFNQWRNNSFGGKFSYCFTQIDESNSPSKLSFGSNALVSGPDVVSTPLIKKSNYRLHLEGITVGNKKLNLDTSGNENEGNIIIDSGTMLTYFIREFYEKLESELVKQINGSEPIKREANGKQGQLCYSKINGDFIAPKIVFHFTDADFELPLKSTFLRTNSRTFCLTMVPSDKNEDKSIFGNLNQMNYLIGYDLVKDKLSFKPTDCSKFP